MSVVLPTELRKIKYAAKVLILTDSFSRASMWLLVRHSNMICITRPIIVKLSASVVNYTIVTNPTIKQPVMTNLVIQCFI